MSRFGDEAWEDLPGDQCSVILATLCTEINILESVSRPETVWIWAGRTRPSAEDFDLASLYTVSDILRQMVRSISRLPYIPSDPTPEQERATHWMVSAEQIVEVFDEYGVNPGWDNFPILNHCNIDNYYFIRDLIDLFHDFQWCFMPVSSTGREVAVESYDNKYSPTITPSDLFGSVSAEGESENYAAYVSISSQMYLGNRLCSANKATTVRINVECESAPQGTPISAKIYTTNGYSVASDDDHDPRDPTYGALYIYEKDPPPHPWSPASYPPYPDIRQRLMFLSEFGEGPFTLFSYSANGELIGEGDVGDDGKSISTASVSLDQSQVIELNMTGNFELSSWSKMEQTEIVVDGDPVITIENLTHFPGGATYWIPEDAWVNEERGSFHIAIGIRFVCMNIITCVI